MLNSCLMLSKLSTIIRNPEILLIILKTGNKKSVKQYLSIKKNRDLMIKICNEIDFMLSKNKTIDEIIEYVSKKFNFMKYPIIWYSLIRKHHLKIVVETGVSMGWSSFMILIALQRENSGKLYSIDIDSSETVKQDGGVGYLVPDYLKKYWNLTIGDTNKLLEPTLRELKQLDMFIHDSEHSYQTMSYEYNLAWKFLKNNRFLCSDDINHSNAFDEFVTQHKHEIENLYETEEIQRPFDDVNKRPMIGFLQKIIT